MPRLILNEVAAYLKQRAENKDTTRRVLGAEEKLVIIWSMTKGWPVAKTARLIGKSTHPIWRYRYQVVHDPQIVFEDLLFLYSELDGHKWSCRFCGESRKNRARIMRHVLGHFLPIEVAKLAPLARVQNPL